MKVLPAALAATATAAALLLASVTPAFAVGSPIDPGDSMFAVNCFDELYNDWQLLSVESATGVSTKIGTGAGSHGTGTSVCGGQPAYDVTTGTSYYIQWTSNYLVDYLATIDPATGASSTIGQFFVMDGELTDHPVVNSIAIGVDGAAYALAEGDLYSLDLGTGELALIGASLSATAFAVDPTSGVFYAVDRFSDLYTVNVATGEQTLVGPIGFPDTDHHVVSLQIDGGGKLWLNAGFAPRHSPVTATLWSVPLATLASPVYAGDFVDDPYFTQALLIIPGATPPSLPSTGPATGPKLAATGADPGLVPLGGAALVLLGAAFLLLRRRAA